MTTQPEPTTTVTPPPAANAPANQTPEQIAAAAAAGTKTEENKTADDKQLLFDMDPNATPEQKAAAEKAAKEKTDADAKKAEDDKVAKMTPEEKAAHEQKKKDDAAAAEKAAFVKLDDITVPDDMPIPEAVKTELSALIEKHKVSGDTGKALTQDMINLHVKMQNDQIESWQKMKTEWKNEIVNDPKIGGANLDTSKTAANEVVRKFAENPEFGGSPELVKSLSDDLILLGLGNKKSFMQFLLNINEHTKSGSIAGTGGTGGADKKPPEKVLWPNMA